METMKVLVVEDDTNIVDTYRSEIKVFNRDTDNKYNYEIEHANNYIEAIEKLKDFNNSFSGAIIDLNLDKSIDDDCSGIEIVDFIKQNLRFPVFIISGTTHHLSDEQKQENELFKVISREDNFDFTEEFRKIYDTGIVDILNQKGLIEKYINEIFWEHLSNSLEPWMGNETNKESKKRSLLRYTIAHLQEYLETNEEGEELSYNPAEFFITGPIKKYLFTGDVFIRNELTYIVITPACDLSNNKAENVLCLKVLCVNEVPKIINQETQKIKPKELSKFLVNNAGDRYHFMPSLVYKNKNYAEGIIDFQSYTAFSYEELSGALKNKEIERYATISQPFLKDLIERYSRYYSRQGAPNMCKTLLENLHLST